MADHKSKLIRKLIKEIADRGQIEEISAGGQDPGTGIFYDTMSFEPRGRVRFTVTFSLDGKQRDELLRLMEQRKSNNDK